MTFSMHQLEYATGMQIHFDSIQNLQACMIEQNIIINRKLNSKTYLDLIQFSFYFKEKHSYFEKEKSLKIFVCFSKL